MRIGVSLPDPSGPDAQGRPPLAQVRDALRRAADEGFASAWMNNIFGLDALTALAVAGSGSPGSSWARPWSPPTRGIRRPWPSRR